MAMWSALGPPVELGGSRRCLVLVMKVIKVLSTRKGTGVPRIAIFTGTVLTMLSVWFKMGPILQAQLHDAHAPQPHRHEQGGLIGGEADINRAARRCSSELERRASVRMQATEGTQV